MTAPIRRRPGGRAARVRSAVLTATLDELADYGYSGLNMERLAQRAGVNKTTIYRRWTSKGALLAEALLFGSDDIEPPDTGDLKRDLLALQITRPAASPERDPLAQAVAVTRALDAVIDDPDVEAARDLLWARRLKVVQAAVDRACARGDLPDDADAEMMVDILFGVFHNRIVARGKPVTRDLMETILDLAIYGASLTRTATRQVQPKQRPVHRRSANPPGRS